MNTSIGPARVPASALLSTWTAHDWRDGLNLGELSALDRITGRAGVEDMLDALFGAFCVGK